MRLSECGAIAIFGGTFDPVHYGHLKAADEVRQQLGLEDFRMLPAGDPPHRNHTHTTAAQRLEMLRLGVAEFPELAIDTREIERDGPSWMTVTLESYARDYPGLPLLLVLGQDAANGLDRWYHWREILERAHLVIMNRPGEAADYSESLADELAPRMREDLDCLVSADPGRVLAVNIVQREISSTQIRQWLSAGQLHDDWLPPAVASYIRKHRLYGVAGPAL